MRRALGSIVLFLGAFCGVPAMAVTLSVAEVSAAPAQTFFVDVKIDGALDVGAWQFDLSFDPTLLQINSVVEGSFMSSFGATLFQPGVADNVSGLLSLVTNSYIDLPPYPGGEGVVATIEFSSLRSGFAELGLSNVFVNFSDADVHVDNGGVLVGMAPIPEPDTLILLIGGLLVVAARARGRQCKTPGATN